MAVVNVATLQASCRGSKIIFFNLAQISLAKFASPTAVDAVWDFLNPGSVALEADGALGYDLWDIFSVAFFI